MVWSMDIAWCERITLRAQRSAGRGVEGFGGHRRTQRYPLHLLRGCHHRKRLLARPRRCFRISADSIQAI